MLGGPCNGLASHPWGSGHVDKLLINKVGTLISSCGLVSSHADVLRLEERAYKRTVRLSAWPGGLA